MFPFIFPNPIVKTDVQPYAAVFATLICVAKFGGIINERENRNNIIILGGTLFVAICVMVFSGVTLFACLIAAALVHFGV